MVIYSNLAQNLFKGRKKFILKVAEEPNISVFYSSSFKLRLLDSLNIINFTIKNLITDNDIQNI